MTGKMSKGDNGKTNKMAGQSNDTSSNDRKNGNTQDMEQEIQNVKLLVTALEDSVEQLQRQRLQGHNSAGRSNHPTDTGDNFKGLFYLWTARTFCQGVCSTL